MSSVFRAAFIGLFATFIFAACGETDHRSDNRAITERPLATPALNSQRPKIVAFGDSLTAGFGLLEKESYPYLLQERLQADGYDYEVINAGVSGDTTLGGVDRIDWVLEMENVEILILELGANDLLRGVPPSRVKANLDTIIRKAKAKGVDVLLCGMLAPPTMGVEYQREYTVAFPDLASEHKIAFVPFLLDKIALQKNLNQADGIHPNAEGTRLMMENIYRVLKPMLNTKS